MSRSLYETRTLSGYAINTIANEIELQKINGRGVVPAEGYKGVYLITEDAETIPPFLFPIEVKEEYFIDARSFTTVGRDGVLKISNQISYEFQLEVAVLEKQWVHTQEKDEFFYLSAETISQYTKWLGDNIAHHYRLDYNGEMQVRACCALYFVGQHFNNIKEDLTRTQMIRYITKNVLTSNDNIEYVLEGQEIEFPRTVEEFCAFLKNTNITLQLRDMEPIVLGNLMNRTFTFGLSNPKIVLTTAYEHPPVFLALMSTILKNSFLRKSMLGEQLYKGRGGASFLSTHSRFIERYKDK